jgi:hypothetical protein
MDPPPEGTRREVVEGEAFGAPVPGLWPGGEPSPHPRGRYRWRTSLRRRLPARLGFLAPKGTRDCGDHDWYNADDNVEHCYHCVVGVRGRISGFATPEEAALDGWPAASKARVVSVTVKGDRAEVVLDTDPHYPYWVYCVRRNGAWIEGVSGNGPTAGWDDLDEFDW